MWRQNKMLKNIQIIFMLLYIKNIVDVILLEAFFCILILNKYILTWLDKTTRWWRASELILKYKTNIYTTENNKYVYRNIKHEANHFIDKLINVKFLKLTFACEHKLLRLMDWLI